MKIGKRFWALAVSRIAEGESLPGRLIERIELKEASIVAEGARIEHPRLGVVTLFVSKKNIAVEAVRLLDQHRVSKTAFMKRYGHWLGD